MKICFIKKEFSNVNEIDINGHVKPLSEEFPPKSKSYPLCTSPKWIPLFLPLHLICSAPPPLPLFVNVILPFQQMGNLVSSYIFPTRITEPPLLLLQHQTRRRRNLTPTALFLDLMKPLVLFLKLCSLERLLPYSPRK